MSAKILLSIVALGGVGLAALPADVLHKPNQEPVALRMDQTPVTQQVASLVPVAPPMPAKPAAETAPVAVTVPVTQPQAAFPPPNAEVATVGNSNLNARQGPATSYDKVFVVSAGEQLAVLDKQGTWVQVKRNSGETGWVHSSYLVGGERADQRPVAVQQERRVASLDAPRSVPADNPAPPTKRAMLGAGSVLFAAPSTSSQPISRVEKGERLRVGERRGDWVRVVTSQGFSGWLLVR